MRTDPRAACANAEERKGWAWLHDAVCHPLMALSGWSTWSVRFHDWTSHHAWPRASGVTVTYTVPSRRHGELLVKHGAAAPGFWHVQHPAIRHAIVVRAGDAVDAVEQAEAWFDSLADVGIEPTGVVPQQRTEKVLAPTPR